MASNRKSHRPRRPPGLSSLEETSDRQPLKSKVEVNLEMNEQLVPPDKTHRTPQKSRKPRKPSATPQPETSTRLRSDLKSTPKGQHLARTLEHRKTLHEQSLLGSPTSKQTDVSQAILKNESLHEPAPGQLAPRALAVPHASGPSENPVIYPTSDMPQQVLYHHPAYGWGFMMQPSFPSPIQQECSKGRPSTIEPAPAGPATTANDGRSPVTQLSDVPYNIAPVMQSTLASPFQPARTTRDTRLGEKSVLASPFQPVERSLKESPALREKQQISLVGDAAGENFERSIDRQVPEDSNSDMPTLMTRGQDTGPLTMHEGPRSVVSSSESQRLDSLSGKEGILLAKGLEVLDDQLRRICASTGLSEEEVVNRWKLADHWNVDLFKIYRQYFDTRVDQELMRLAKELRPHDRDRISNGLIQETFELFKADNPEYRSFLMDWSQFHDIAATSNNSSARSQQFEKYIRKIKGLLECASALLGFEAVFCTVGREIHTDQALSRTICSPMVLDFFQDRLRISESEVFGHLKAHAYNCVSKRSPPNIPLVSTFDQDIQPGRRLSPRPVTLSSHAATENMFAGDNSANDSSLSGESRVKENSLACGEGGPNGHCTDTSPTPLVAPPALARSASQLPEEAVKPEIPRDDHLEAEKQKKKRTIEGDMVQELKQRLFDLTKHCQIRQLSNKTIQFANLPNILSKHGWILENWPEELDFPCDIRRGKGVAGLGVHEQEILLKSLQDPDFPLRVVKRANTALPDTEPIIIGVPPPPQSVFTHGRRRFLRAIHTEDRGGPPRLECQAIHPSCQALASRSTTREASLDAHEMNQLKRQVEDESDDLGDKCVNKKARLEKRVTFSPNVSDDEDASSSSEADGASSDAQGQDFESTSSEDFSSTEPIEQFNEASTHPVFQRAQLAEAEAGPSRRSPTESGKLPDYIGDRTTVPNVVIQEYMDPYRPAGVRPMAQPTGFWYPVQQTGASHYPVNIPSGPPLFPFPSHLPPNNQGTKYQMSRPEATGFHYQRSLGNDAAGQQLLQVPTRAPVVPFIPQSYPQSETYAVDSQKNRHGTGGL